jgi:alcohol dehydrogenase class IV
VHANLVGSVSGTMHGVTSCVVLASVLRYTSTKWGKQQLEAQEKVLRVFNETLEWEETSAADAVAKFVAMLELPKSLREVGAGSEGMMDKVAEQTLTDIWGGGKRQLDTKEEVLEILRLARG